MQRSQKFNPASLINYAVLAIVGLLGYRLYKIFYNPIGDKKTTDEKVQASQLTTSETSMAADVIQLKKDLDSKGLKVSSLHTGIANQLHSLMNVVSTDEGKIVSIVNSIKSKETVQLVRLAYACRELDTYRGSHFSTFFTDLFESLKLYGNLKFHLQTVLSDTDLRKISNNMQYL